MYKRMGAAFAAGVLCGLGIAAVNLARLIFFGARVWSTGRIRRKRPDTDFHIDWSQV